MMLERCSHPWSDVIYNGFSGGARAGAPAAPQPRAPIWPRRAAAFAGGALAVAAIFAAFPLIDRVSWPHPPAARVVIAPATAPPARTPSAALPPPSVAELATAPATSGATPEVAALTDPSAPHRDLVKPPPRRRLRGSASGADSVFRSRASVATSLANLSEAYAPSSTLSAQATEQPTEDDGL